MADKKLKLQAPWTILYDRLCALFKHDDEVRVEYDDEYTIKIYVDNNRKCDALAMILPPEKTYGNVTVKIQVIPANADGEPTYSELFADAFANNPIFSYAKHFEGQLGTWDYVVFTPVIAQYYSDNMFDINGCTSELYQDLAKDVFDNCLHTVHFCTDLSNYTK